MIQGFIINKGNTSTFGVGVWGEEVPAEDVIVDVARAAWCDENQVELIDAEDLVEYQYKGVAFLTTEAED